MSGPSLFSAPSVRSPPSQDWVRLAATWFAAAAIAGPLGIVLHELAHFIPAAAFGFEGAALRSTSIDYAQHNPFWYAFRTESVEAASRILPVWQVGVVTASGIVVTLALAVIAAVLAPGWGLATFGGATLASFALLAPLRGYTALLYIVRVRPRYPEAFPNVDEFRAAQVTGVPVEVWVVLGAVVVLFCWVRLVPKLRIDVGRGLLVAMPALVVGTVAGVVVWIYVGGLLLG